MGLTGKLIFPLLGVVLLCGVALAGELNYDDVNTLPAAEKRRIIRELLRAQKDIREALLKVHYSLNGEEYEGEDREDRFWQGCWDKDLHNYRKGMELKMVELSDSMKMAEDMMDEINDRVKGPSHGPYRPDYGGNPYGENGPYVEYGPPSYNSGYGNEGGYGPGKPTRPPLTTPETTSWRPTTESYVPPDDDDDDYYARHRPLSGNRRYGRGLEVPDHVAGEVEKPEDPMEDREVVEAMDLLADDKQ